MEAIVSRSPPPLRLLKLTDGRRLACAEFGDPNGLPVIALHGTPGSRLMYAVANTAAWERGIRLIAPDRPGYGLSDCRQSDSLVSAVEDLRIVADAYELERFAVIGVSGGAPYAVAVAAAMPDRVGQTEPNKFGLYDLSGNVWEWCGDYYARGYPPGPRTDPKGPADGDLRVVRGGAFDEPGARCRCAE